MRLSAVLVLIVVSLLVGAGCSFGSASATPTPVAQVSPTPLPPPKPITSPDTAVASAPSPSPAASPAAGLAPPGPAPVAGERVKVANTGGDGANMRAEPATTAALVRAIRDGTELEVIGADREAGGRNWRNVRDPASGASGWIAADFLVPATPGAGPAGAPAAPAAAPPAAQPGPAASPAAGAAPPPASQPPPSAPASGGASAGLPPAPSPAPASGQAASGPRIGDADRAYLGTLQPQVDALGKSITAANEQIERAGGRPDITSDPTWRQDTKAAADALNDAAAKIKASSPGPNTGEVQRHAQSAAEHASAAAAALTSTMDSGDTRTLNDVRTELVRVLAEINNMNLSLLTLQS